MYMEGPYFRGEHSASSPGFPHMSDALFAAWMDGETERAKQRVYNVIDGLYFQCVSQGVQMADAWTQRTNAAIAAHPKSRLSKARGSTWGTPPGRKVYGTNGR